MANLERLVPCLWFDTQAEEAAKYYCGIFKNSRVTRIEKYTEAGQEVHGKPPGSVMVAEFELDGQKFTALNGGPHFTFNEAVSFQVMCEDQKEIDYYWDKLGAGGDPKAQVCGWLKDQYGLSWQVVPKKMPDLSTPRGKKQMEAFLKMKKIDIAALERAGAA
jgi:predicted 3-demethylubiquinone-9 3-methyltransferase (glyoxalase superfamily)